MIIAASGDNHFDLSSRFEECLRIHDFIADDIDQRCVDLFCVPGDWFERTSKAAERNAVRQFLQKVSINRPVVGVRGNHDSVEDLQIFNHIRSAWPIFVEETVSVRSVETPSGTAMVACVAWPRKAQLLSLLGSDVSREDSEVEVREQLRILMLGLRSELLKHEGPRILIMHAMLCGATTSIGQPLVGCDVEVSEQILALTEADVILLSHVHKPQHREFNGIPIIYTGSPYATEWGETEEKSYVIVEFEEQRDADGRILRTWYRVPTPRTPMILFNAAYQPEVDKFFLSDDAPFDYSDEAIRGSEIRYRYSVDADYAEAARVAVRKVEQELRAAGASVVKIEEVRNPTTRARAPEISEAQSVEDELKILWNRRGLNISPERLDRLFAKHLQVETETRVDGQ